MTADSVETNYNDIGTIVMEMIYGADFLSPGGIDTTQGLAELADIAPGSRVLDVGCGLGGAVFFLAEKKACKVTGIDLMEDNISQANHRAREKNLLESTHFEVGDAHALPYPPGTFDVVWGQDAWCHVDDKQALIEQAHRVLTDRGWVAFSDWLLRDEKGPLNEKIRRVAASENMASEQAYRSYLADCGFSILHYADTSQKVAQRYTGVLESLHSFEAEIGARFSAKVFEIIRSKQQLVLDAFVTGELGAGDSTEFCVTA